MTITRRVAGATLAALLLLSLNVPTADATPARPTTVLATPAQVPPKIDRYEAWPNLVMADNGWVVMFHAATDSHGFPTRRRIVVRVSKDRGATWTITKIITSPTGMTGHGGIVRLPSGRLLISVSDLNGHDDHNWTQFWRSDDDGRTWTVHSPRLPWTDAWSYGNILRVTCDGGKLVEAWNGQAVWGIATSRDDGATWSRSYEVAQHVLFEGRIVQVGGDRLLMLGRNRDLGLTAFRSDDCGATWTSSLTGIGGGEDGWLTEGAVQHPSRDLWRMVTINRETFQMEVRDGTLSELWDDPTAWSPPKLLRTLKATTSPVDLGYPQLVSASASFDLLVWYGATGTPRQPMVYTARIPWPA